MIGPLGWLFAISTLILGVSLYRTQNEAIRLRRDRYDLAIQVASLRRQIEQRQRDRVARLVARKERSMRPSEAAVDESAAAVSARVRSRLKGESLQEWDRMVAKFQLDRDRPVPAQTERESPGSSAK